MWVDYYTLSLRFAKAGVPPQRAREVAAIFGRRFGAGAGAGAAAGVGAAEKAPAARTVAGVVRDAAAQLDVATGETLAATLDDCVRQLGLSTPEGGGTLRERAARVAAELQLVTGW